MTRRRATIEEMHALLRRLQCAAASVKQWDRLYREGPDDYAGAKLYAGWVEMRSAVDAIVAMDPPDLDQLALAACPGSLPPVWVMSATRT